MEIRGHNTILTTFGVNHVKNLGLLESVSSFGDKTFGLTAITSALCFHFFNFLQRTHEKLILFIGKC
jgi:hypothetical protein